MGKKVSELTEASSLNNDDLLYVAKKILSENGYQSNKATLNTFKNLFSDRFAQIETELLELRELVLGYGGLEFPRYYNFTKLENPDNYSMPTSGWIKFGNAGGGDSTGSSTTSPNIGSNPVLKINGSENLVSNHTYSVTFYPVKAGDKVSFNGNIYYRECEGSTTIDYKNDVVDIFSNIDAGIPYTITHNGYLYINKLSDYGEISIRNHSLTGGNSSSYTNAQMFPVSQGDTLTITTKPSSGSINLYKITNGKFKYPNYEDAGVNLSVESTITLNSDGWVIARPLCAVVGLYVSNAVKVDDGIYVTAGYSSITCSTVIPVMSGDRIYVPNYLGRGSATFIPYKVI